MADGAKLRASLLKGTLESIDELLPEESSRIRALLSPSVLREIESASRVEWISFELNLQVLDAALKTLGPERYRALRVHTAGKIARSPILASVLSGALHLFGASP